MPYKPDGTEAYKLKYSAANTKKYGDKMNYPKMNSLMKETDPGVSQFCDHLEMEESIHPFLREIVKKYKPGGVWTPYEQWDKADFEKFMGFWKDRYVSLCNILEAVGKLEDDDKLDLEKTDPNVIRIKGLELSERVIEYLLNTYSGNDLAIPPELFPVFKPQRSVELTKEFALNFGGLERIEQDYKGLLSQKLSSGMTLQQHIDKVRDWFNSLHGESLGNWIKLFAYVKAVKEFTDTETDAINFRAVSPGKYSFSIRQDKGFFRHFIRPDKKSGQFTTKAKTRFLKWLYDNQTTIEFPIIVAGKVWNMPMKIYQYAENVTDKQIFFIVDTNILESEFRDYVSINTDEVDAIAEQWETLADSAPDFKTYSLGGFVDIPLKFLLTLKNIYNRNGNYRNKDYTGNVQTLSRESLNAHLGGLSERLQKQLKVRGKIRTGKTSGNPEKAIKLILETTFTIATKRGWLVTMPTYKDWVYKFNINAGYFDRKETARRLKSP